MKIKNIEIDLNEKIVEFVIVFRSKKKQSKSNLKTSMKFINISN